MGTGKNLKALQCLHDICFLPESFSVTVETFWTKGETPSDTRMKCSELKRDREPAQTIYKMDKI